MEVFAGNDWHNEFSAICTSVCKCLSGLEMCNHIQAFTRGLASGLFRSK